MDPSRRLKSVVESLRIVDVKQLESDDDKAQVVMLCSVSNAKLATVSREAVVQAWLSVIEAILAEEQRMKDDVEDEYEAFMIEYDAESDQEPPVRGKPPWFVDISKKYMLHNGKLMFGWRFILKANTDIKTAVADISRLLIIMRRHVDVFLTQYKPVSPGVGPNVNVRLPAQSVPAGSVPGTGTAGTIGDDGLVIEMPLIGATANRNAPQAPMLTPGVQGRGRKSGVSSKGAHMIGTK